MKCERERELLQRNSNFIVVPSSAKALTGTTNKSHRTFSRYSVPSSFSCVDESNETMHINKQNEKRISSKLVLKNFPFFSFRSLTYSVEFPPNRTEKQPRWNTFATTKVAIRDFLLKTQCCTWVRPKSPSSLSRSPVEHCEPSRNALFRFSVSQQERRRCHSRTAEWNAFERKNNEMKISLLAVFTRVRYVCVKAAVVDVVVVVVDEERIPIRIIIIFVVSVFRTLSICAIVC